MSHKVTLVLQNNNFFKLDQNILFFLGNPIIKDASFFETKDQLISFLELEKIEKILFFSPYASIKNKRLYDWIREFAKTPYIICEKGALPDSIYLDDSGFLNDSDYYQPKHWDKPLSSSQRHQITNYIDQTLKSGITREENKERKDLSQIKKELGLSANHRILFVPFQRRKDSVIRYFCGEIKSYDCFRDVIQKFAISNPEWKVIYKNHPNEKELLHIESAVCADDYHIYDLIQLSDSVALINSGSGIYSLMMGKPTYVFGNAWYAHENLTVSVDQKKPFDEYLVNPVLPDYERVLRFLHYLRFIFYSFVNIKESFLSDGSPTYSVMIRELGYIPSIKNNSTKSINAVSV